MLQDTAGRLLAVQSALLGKWRRSWPGWSKLAPQAQQALEHILVRPSLGQIAAGAFDAHAENVNYYSRRLAKLRLPLVTVSHAVERFAEVAEKMLPPEADGAAMAVMDSFLRSVSLLIGQAYDEVQRGAVATLLEVLDAELDAESLDDLLRRLLAVAAKAFHARWAGILLCESWLPQPTADFGPACRPRLLLHALHGVEQELAVPALGAGQFFQDVVRRARPAMLLDAANDPRIVQPYFRTLNIATVWAVPLRRRATTPDGQPAGVLGVLHVDFDRRYAWLPQELDLLGALAERSSLALERARLIDLLQVKQHQVRELSEELLRAQDDERRRISRELHDDTGQALLTIRLRLELARRQKDPVQQRQEVDTALALVDRSVKDLRRIIARLSPLALEELGLAAALRADGRTFSQTWSIRTEVRIVPARARFPPALELLLYRLVQEALTNIAKHAAATRAWVRITAGAHSVSVVVADNGVGLRNAAEASGHDSRHPPQPAAGLGHFGLAGMRQRTELAGGKFHFGARPGGGARLEIEIPLTFPEMRLP